MGLASSTVESKIGSSSSRNNLRSEVATGHGTSCWHHLGVGEVLLQLVCSNQVFVNWTFDSDTTVASIRGRKLHVHSPIASLLPSCRRKMVDVCREGSPQHQGLRNHCRRRTVSSLAWASLTGSSSASAWWCCWFPADHEQARCLLEVQSTSFEVNQGRCRDLTSSSWRTSAGLWTIEARSSPYIQSSSEWQVVVSSEPLCELEWHQIHLSYPYWLALGPAHQLLFCSCEQWSRHWDLALNRRLQSSLSNSPRVAMWRLPSAISGFLLARHGQLMAG